MVKAVVLGLILLLKNVQSDLIVDLPNGKVQGTSYTTPDGKTFYAWRGIPYAQPPLGPLRFLPPVKAEPWKGILNATEDKPACIFFSDHYPNTMDYNSEDCLYVNVYTPQPVTKNSSLSPKTPVMFWIYGGAYVFGDSRFTTYDPRYFLEENVIFVSFNYRLGTLGFLSTEDDVILGNAGMKDQWMALKWTRENIAFFGGNPEDITIFGESAGAISVGYHLISPMSRGLFAAAILESGNEITSFFQDDAKGFTVNLANQFDSNITNSSSSTEIRNVLQAAPLEQLVNYSLAIAPYSFGIFIKIRSVLEVPSNFSFLTSPIYEELAVGNCSKVPVILGYNGQEAVGLLPDLKTIQNHADQVDENPEGLLPDMLYKDGANKTKIAQKIREFYIGKDGQFGKNLLGFVEWFSDNVFIRNVYKHAAIYSEYAPTYLYQFTFFGAPSQRHVNISGSSQVGHGDDLAYIFNTTNFPALHTDREQLTRKRIVKLWTNFAKTKNPTPESDELLQNVKWEAVTSKNLQFLSIDDDLQMQPNSRKEMIKFWTDIWETYSYHPYNTI